MGEYAEWARVPGRKWHWLKEPIRTDAIGHTVRPACSLVPGMGNARPFPSTGARLSVGVPKNRRKKGWRATGLSHLCQHCVIAAASNGYRFE